MITMGSVSKNVYKSKTLQQIINIAKSTDYFTAKIVNNSLKSIQQLSLGQILYGNIEEQWKHAHNSIKFLNINEPIEYEKYFSNGELNGNNRSDASAITSKCLVVNAPTMPDDLIDDFPTKTILSCTYCCSDLLAIEMFSKIQRQRKIWWMNFAANPQRISISELKTKEMQTNICDGIMQSVWIQSKFPFGSCNLETIDMIPMRLAHKDLSKSTLIRTSMLLDNATVECVMDAIDDSDGNEICLHRNLAPYQCQISIYMSENQFSANHYNDLAKYIMNALESNGISVRYEADKYLAETKVKLNEIYENCDGIGVPYCIVLSEQSLQTGLLQLRNRDTTLCETIHLSDVPGYLLKIFRN